MSRLNFELSYEGDRLRAGISYTSDAEDDNPLQAHQLYFEFGGTIQANRWRLRSTEHLLDAIPQIRNRLNLNGYDKLLLDHIEGLLHNYAHVRGFRAEVKFVQEQIQASRRRR